MQISPHTFSTLCRISGGIFAGVYISDEARPRLIGNEIFGNGRGGVGIIDGGEPHLSGNTIRDHAGARGVGVLVQTSSHGLATILPDNVFLRNEGGDVVREAAPPPDSDDD